MDTLQVALMNGRAGLVQGTFSSRYAGIYNISNVSCLEEIPRESVPRNILAHHYGEMKGMGLEVGTAAKIVTKDGTHLRREVCAREGVGVGIETIAVMTVGV